MAEFAVGTYSGSIHLLRINKRNIEETVESADKKDINDMLEIETLFSHDTHSGCVKCISLCEKFMATSSSDEVLRIYTIEDKKQIGSILKHGTINDMKFYKNSNLITLSNDGYLRIFSTKNWEMINEIKAHSGGGISLSLPNSMFFGITVGNDCKVKLWDFIKGISINKVKLDKKPYKILFSPCSTYYYIITDNLLKIFNITQNTASEVKFDKNILAVDFIDKNIIVIGGEFRYVAIYDLNDQKIIIKIPIRFNRTRDLCVLNIENYGAILVLTFSQGNVIIYDVRNIKPDVPLEILFEFSINNRIVCCSSYDSCN